MTTPTFNARPIEPLPPAGTRYHYMDNLRALAMLAGIFFHAALAYSPLLHELWLTADSETSPVMDAFAWFTHLFRMPLFFLIAGFFACYLVEKRGLGGFLKNRTLRILVPFVVFLPLVWAALAGGVGWAMSHVEQPSPMLSLFSMMANIPDAPPPPVTTTHLWFLYNLFQFCLVYALLSRVGLLASKWLAFLASPRFLVFGLPLMVLPALLTQAAPFPAPEQFTPKLWSFGFYGLFFLVGSQFFRRQGLLDELKSYTPWLAVSSLALYALLYALLPRAISLEEAMTIQQGVALTPKHALACLLEAVIAVHMTLVCLVLGKRFMDRANPMIRFVADSSYWVYIIHLPLLFFIQYLLLDTPWNLWLEFALSSLGTLTIGIASYALLVRWTPVGWLLNGRRSRKGGATAAADNLPSPRDKQRPEVAVS